MNESIVAFVPPALDLYKYLGKDVCVLGIYKHRMFRWLYATRISFVWTLFRPLHRKHELLQLQLTRLDPSEERT